MRIVIQRVKSAKVDINQTDQEVISNGMVILVGIEEADTKQDADWLANKTLKLRIYDDAEGIMNRSIIDVKGDILVISQFTLHASTKKGNRPSYIKAAKAPISVPLYKYFVEQLRSLSKLNVKTGSFGAYMQVHLINDGPVTIIIDSKNRE